MTNVRKFAPLVLIAVMASVGCRLDMHEQPRYNPLAKSDFFPDQRSSRPRVEGTVARGDERTDTYFYTGKIGNNDGDFMPFPVTREVLDRGRDRYNVYCSPCHSRVGDGNGFIPSRGFALVVNSSQQGKILGNLVQVVRAPAGNRAELALADEALSKI